MTVKRSEASKAKRRAYNREWYARPEVKAKQRENYTRYRANKSTAQKLWDCAKSRSNKYGIEFALQVTDIVVPERCPVLGMEFSKGPYKIHDASATLDRIDSRRGYVPGNVRVISWKANRIKNNATPDELEAVARYAREALNGSR